jgi:hypothetical protein
MFRALRPLAFLKRIGALPAQLVGIARLLPRLGQGHPRGIADPQELLPIRARRPVNQIVRARAVLGNAESEARGRAFRPVKEGLGSLAPTGL